jgi:hypothetical protein
MAFKKKVTLSVRNDWESKNYENLATEGRVIDLNITLFCREGETSEKRVRPLTMLIFNFNFK